MQYLLTDQETESFRFKLLRPDVFDSWLPLFRAHNIAKIWTLTPDFQRPTYAGNRSTRCFTDMKVSLGEINVLIDKKTGLLAGQGTLLVQTIKISSAWRSATPSFISITEDAFVSISSARALVLIPSEKELSTQ